VSQDIPAALDAALRELACTPELLVATDYDGTLSPIVDDPALAFPLREAMVALRSLAELPHTHVAVISGRSLHDLAVLTESPAGVHLVGSHGSEFDPDFASELPADAVSLRNDLVTQLTRIANDVPGCTIETKPASVAFHYRNAPAKEGLAAADLVLNGPAKLPGVQLKLGKMVVELGVVEPDKGRALETIRHRVGASAAIFLGDDVTDEDAFATLRGPDLSIKVGSGQSCAKLRVGTTHEVARVLARLAEARSAWLAGSTATPIDHHSMLSDQRTIALVDSNARVCWLCAPRIDSAAMFAELLGGAGSGYFAITDADGNGPTRQEYDGSTLVLRSIWPTMTVTDYLDCSQGRPRQRAGRLEFIRVIEGSGTAKIEFAPRMDFGRSRTRLHERVDGLEISETLEPVVLRAAGVQWTIEDVGQHHTGTAEVDLSNGPVVLELRYGTGNTSTAVLDESTRRNKTLAFWNDWAQTLRLPELHSDMMLRGALVLRGLVHGPTGAIAAAATTSLPEHLGGVRNWDYRYCWPRDAAMAATTLTKLGSSDEALGLLDWLLNIIDESGHAERLAPIYTVRGHDLPPESEITELSGYAGSRPVRVGNAAAHQVQLDVFGPIMELIWTLCEAGAPLSTEHWRLAQAMADAVLRRWQEPDHGIWEIRGPWQHHVHSKTMCWVTLDRAGKIAERFLGRQRPDYLEAAEIIKAEVLEQGWNEKVGAFTASYGSEQLDAAALLIGLSGLIDPKHPRFAKTVEAVEAGLREGATVYRYRYDDGLPGTEGGFHICATWLVEAYALVGRTAEAHSLLNDIAKLAGPTGLFSEQHDPRSGRALGNHPQAYSHLGLIEAALRLEALGQRYSPSSASPDTASAD
jgi:trehalose 6-phosphate phosphatase